MPYKPARRKPYKKKRVYRRRKPKMNLQKMITGIVNKNRESKRLYHTVDGGFPLAAGTKGNEGFLTASFPLSNQAAGFNFNQTNIGENPWERNGNEITPCYFNFNGVITLTGTSARANRDLTQVRIVCGFVKANLQANNVTLQLTNGVTQPISTDYLALYRKFNWQEFRPFYDRTFKLGPSFDSAAMDSVLHPDGGFVVNGNNIGTCKKISIKHYFGKTPRNMKYPRTGDTILANDRNIQMLVICRNANNENYYANDLDINVLGEGHFSFKDC